MSDDLTDNLTSAVPEGFSVLAWHRGFGRQIGPLYEKIAGDGRCVRAFRVEEHHTNGMNNAHGGMLMSFADVAWGHVVDAGPDHWWVTVRLVCDFLSGAAHGDWVEGTGEIVGKQGEIYTVRGRIWCGTRTLMTGTGTFKLLRRPASKLAQSPG